VEALRPGGAHPAPRQGRQLLAHGRARPGGPCSEIYYDRGSEYGREGGPVADEDRYLEVWNLVFMQYQLSTVRTKVDFDIAGPLPAQNIDTGMGIERVATVLQGVDNLYEIDTSRAILDRAAALTGVTYGRRPCCGRRLRVVADHARTAVMLIGDGVRPGNEARDYVLRADPAPDVRSCGCSGLRTRPMQGLVRRPSGRWDRSTRAGAGRLAHHGCRGAARRPPSSRR
jgi:hypothetical protein